MVFSEDGLPVVESQEILERVGFIVANIQDGRGPLLLT
jgi:hypothetical protein